MQISALWANIFAINKADQSLEKLKNILVKKDNSISPYSFFKELQESSPTVFNKIVRRNDLFDIEESLSNWKREYSSYVDKCFELSILLSSINSAEAKYYLEKGVTEGILRHGWHKDIIVSYYLIEGLEIIWNRNWLTIVDKRNITEQVFNLAIKVSMITDGDETWRSPYRVIKVVSQHDLSFAENLRQELERNHEIRKSNSLAITPILIGKIDHGYLIYDIKEEMKKYRIEYDYEGVPRREIFEEKFIIYLKLAESELYSESDRKLAFDEAYELINDSQRMGVKYAFKDEDLKEEKQRYEKLCAKYDKTFNLKYSTTQDYKERRTPVISEQEFVNEVKKSISKNAIFGKYRKLKNYKNGIILKEYDSWKVLIDKTYEVYENISLFTDYLESCYYPDSDFMTANSSYLYKALAAALDNINTRQEILSYLYENSGHGGFINIMKAFELLEDKNTCLSIYKRAIKFCELIVY
ncbi:hypothetical protein [Halobacillus karajensis]|nr:hypothetical protein [Halobacillus karajensis]CDQ21223.1 hypothetical protein BN982_03589 [Halobacillus karajensis]